MGLAAREVEWSGCRSGGLQEEVEKWLQEGRAAGGSVVERLQEWRAAGGG